MKTLTLIGAYGRETNIKDWYAGKDFKIIDGTYCSMRDMHYMKKDGFDLLTFVNSDGKLIHSIPLCD